MSMFTLAISCLTTSNLPWFMDLFQFPMQYCFLRHQNLLPSPLTSTTVCCFGSVSSFFLELFLHWSPVACWAPTYLWSSSFSVLSFCLFILFMGSSRQEYWSGLPFPSPVGHILSDLSTMTHLSWLTLYSMAHSFIELDKAVVLWLVWLVIRLVSFMWLWFSVCLPSEKDKRLMEASWWWRNWLRGKLAFVLMGRAMLSKSLIQFPVDGWGCVPSLLLTWGQTMVELMKIMASDLLQKVPCMHCCRPPPTHTSARDSWTLMGKLIITNHAI